MPRARWLYPRFATDSRIISATVLHAERIQTMFPVLEFLVSPAAQARSLLIRAKQRKSWCNGHGTWDDLMCENKYCVGHFELLGEGN